MGITTDHNDEGLKKIRSDGQQENYLALSEKERAKGFVRPLRHSYKHLRCNTITTMGTDLAETLARDPTFYGGTYCAHCRTHFAFVKSDGSRAFVWNEDGTGVGE